MIKGWKRREGFGKRGGFILELNPQSTRIMAPFGEVFCNY